MASLSRKIAHRGIHQAVRLLSVSVALLTHTMVRADEPTTVEPVPPSPMPASVASTPAAVSPASKLWQDRPLASLKTTIKPTEGELPTNVAAPRLAEAGTQYRSFGDSRPWMLSSYEWETPATRHLPLLFEEPNLERLGYTYGCCHSIGCCHKICCCESCLHPGDCLQPIVSGVHFFGRIPFIPYMWGYQSPCQPVYTLGVDRPGSPVCYHKHLIPLSLKGALYQAGFITGLVFLIP